MEREREREIERERERERKDTVSQVERCKDSRAYWEGNKRTQLDKFGRRLDWRMARMKWRQ